jgi:hypothetical protein
MPTMEDYRRLELTWPVQQKQMADHEAFLSAWQTRLERWAFELRERAHAEIDNHLDAIQVRRPTMRGQ